MTRFSAMRFMFLAMLVFCMALCGYAKEGTALEKVVGDAEELELTADEMQQELESGLFKAIGILPTSSSISCT